MLSIRYQLAFTSNFFLSESCFGLPITTSYLLQFTQLNVNKNIERIVTPTYSELGKFQQLITIFHCQTNTTESLAVQIIKPSKLTSIYQILSNFIRTLLYYGSVKIADGRGRIFMNQFILQQEYKTQRHECGTNDTIVTRLKKHSL